MIKNIPKNKDVAIFTVGRYFSYLLIGIRGILVAKFLGPFYLGIYGFLMLVHKYLTYTNLGIPFGVNTKLALSLKATKEEQQKIISSSFTISIIVFILLGIIWLVYFISNVDINIFDKYNFREYSIYIYIFTILVLSSQLFANIYRAYGLLNRIIVGEIINAIATLSVVPFYNGIALMRALFNALIISKIIANIIFIVKSPFKLGFSVEKKFIINLLKISIPLLIYNVSFYLILVFSKTVVGIYYTIKEMGYYSLAITLTNAAMLGLGAVTWVYYPVLLSKFKVHEFDKSKLRNFIQEITSFYTLTVSIIIIFVISMTPLIFILLKQYSSIQNTLNILLLSQIVFSLSFASNTFLIARNKQIILALISMIPAIIVLILCVSVAKLNLNIDFVGYSVLIGYLIFTMISIIYSNAILRNIQFGFILKILFFVLIFTIMSILKLYMYIILPGIIYLLVNYKKIKELIYFVRKRM